MMRHTERERRAVACRRRNCRIGPGGPKGPPYGKFETTANSPKKEPNPTTSRAGDQRSPLQQMDVPMIFARDWLYDSCDLRGRMISAPTAARCLCRRGRRPRRPCRMHAISPMCSGESAPVQRRGRRPRRPFGEWEEMQKFLNPY